MAEELFRKASESIEVLAPPLRGGRRPRHAPIGDAGAESSVRASAAAVVVVAGLTWLDTRPSPRARRPRPADGRRGAANPVDVAWYAAGKLHLDDVTVELPGVTDFVEVNGGAVYGDRSGHGRLRSTAPASSG